MKVKSNILHFSMAPLRTMLACLFLGMAFIATARAGWEFREYEQSRTAFIKISGTVSSGQAMSATLLLDYSKEDQPAPQRIGKALGSIKLCVHNPSNKTFNFEDFNGPDSPASLNKKLLRIEIGSGNQKRTERFSPSGFENHLEWMLDGVPEKFKAGVLDFTFGLYNDPRNSTAGRASFKRVADGLRSGAKVTIFIEENASPKRTLQFAIPQEGTAQALEKLLR